MCFIEAEEERIGTKYYWRGRKEEYLIKELGYTEKHLTDIITKVTQFR
jgi:hypothetical protein